MKVPVLYTQEPKGESSTLIADLIMAIGIIAGMVANHHRHFRYLKFNPKFTPT